MVSEFVMGSVFDKMTKDDILEYFKDINFLYNESTRFDSLKNMLDELEIGTQEQGWISVKDRLPEPFSMVLGYLAWGGYSVLSYENKHFHNLGSFQPLPDDVVTHWIPMPEPPKEENPL